MRKYTRLFKTLAFAASLSCSHWAVATNDFNAVDEKVEQLLSQMTLEEKASLTSGQRLWNTKAIERLGIPSIMMTDGPHGVRKSANGQFGNSIPSTTFPPAVTLASTWNTDLAYEVGRALGKESQVMDVQILLGPGTNIKRSPLGGRNFEYFSEDPIVSGNFSAAFIQGVDSQGVGSSLKHYAVNNQEYERMTISAEVSPRALHEIYLRPFEIAVRESNPATLMSAYNKVNGVYASDNQYLLSDILRNEWGFEGAVVSDWGAVDDRVQGIRAQLDLQMPGDGGKNDQKVVAAVKSGQLQEAELDQVVRPLLKVILTLDQNKGQYTSYDEQAHHEIAKKVAAEGAVLLKNENNILPLAREDKVAVIGNFAKLPRYQGSGSSMVEPTQLDNLYQHLSKQRNTTFAKGYDLMGKTSSSLLNQAILTAREADKVVLVVGLTFIEESEAYDRASYSIAPDHLKLLQEVVKVNSNVVVVLQNGSPVAMPWIENVDAVLEAYLGGQGGGSALADILTGQVNPSGKLAETFPVRIEDNPSYINWLGEEGKVRYGEGIFVGYRYYDKKKITPLFPFGFGLSYTDFAFSDLSLNKSSLTENESIEVSVTVTNTGKVAGQEVVQLYVSDQQASVQRPEKELKHFAKVSLKPGERKTVKFELSFRDFAFFSETHNRWVAESGEFSILVGNASNQLPLKQSVTLNVLNPPKKLFTRYSLLKDLKGHPVGDKLVEKVYKALIGSRLDGKDFDLMTDEEKVTYKKTEVLFEHILDEMPFKIFSSFAGKNMTDKDVEKLIDSPNQ
jgi:beta-glucosidase